MALYRGRYRTKSARLVGWDYAAPGWYFVTICTRGRAPVLGSVDVAGTPVVETPQRGVSSVTPQRGVSTATPQRGVSTAHGGLSADADEPGWPPLGVRLSPIGEIVAEQWLAIPRIRPEVRLDAWVVMPDHLHGILRIVAMPQPRDSAPTSHAAATPDHDDHSVESRSRGASAGSRLHPGSLGAIIGQFKSTCTKRIRARGHSGFAWQPRSYDQIVRDRQALEQVRRYVAENPWRWDSRGRQGRPRVVT